MPCRAYILSFGLLFNAFYMLLTSVCSTIFRDSSPLSTAVAFVFIFLGETLGALPLVPFALKNWSVRTRTRLATFVVFGFIINAHFISWRAATCLMPLASYIAINNATILFVPAVHAALLRRYVSTVDIVGIFGAIIGVLLVTRPPFIFEENNDVPAYAYALAFSCGVYSMSYPFFFGATADAHWSNFLVLRVGCSAVVAAVCVAISGGVAAFSEAPALPLADVFMVGIMSTVYRLSQQIGCSELEALEAGLAGVVGNVFNAGVIPITALLAMGFFGERPTGTEAAGIGVVFFSIFIISISKCWGRKAEDGEKDEEIDVYDGEEEERKALENEVSN